MYKSRTVPTDWGDRSDGKYYPSTTSVKTWTSIYQTIKNDPVAQYLWGRSMATQAIAPPSGVGQETLYSTTRPRPIFNDCEHASRRVYNNAYHLMTRWPLDDPYAVWKPYWRSGVYGAWGSIPSLIGVTWADVVECQRRAWWSMQPRFESDFSLINFIYELKDFKHLAKMAMNFKWSSFAKKVQKAQSYFSALGKGLTKHPFASVGGTLYDATGVLAQGWLAKTMMVDPTLSDVASIIDLLGKTVDEAQEEFSKRGLDAQKSHYTEVLDQQISGAYSGVHYEYFFGSIAQATFTATLEYAYSYTMRGGMDKFRAYWGMDLTAEAVWNMIPLSFIADYFLKIGDALHFAALDPNVVLKQLQYCESILSYSTVCQGIDKAQPAVDSLVCYPTNRGGKFRPEGHEIIPVTGYESSYYRRRVCSPNKGMALPRLTTPKSRQVYNLAALVRGFLK